MSENFMRTASIWTVLFAVRLAGAADAPVGVLTGRYGMAVLGPPLAATGRDDVRLIEVTTP